MSNVLTPSPSSGTRKERGERTHVVFDQDRLDTFQQEVKDVLYSRQQDTAVSHIGTLVGWRPQNLRLGAAIAAIPGIEM